ncbi:MAG: ribonuclease P protein component [Legionella sp.]|nr:ribonuclease P protein component [Legionella sp.]
MFSFKKTQRLLKKIDYDYVFEQAKKVVYAEFTVLYRKNELDCSRLGLAISKKMIAKAHDRNRIKRLIRESFRTNKLPAVDVVFLARPGLLKQSNTEMNSNLSTIWERLIKYYEK